MDEPQAERPNPAGGTVDAPAARTGSRRRSPMAVILLLAFAGLVIFIGSRIFVFQPFNIVGSAMNPTLLVGDYVVVSKYSYGYSRYSFPFGLIPFEGRIWATPPERGDVAVFRNPMNRSEDYIKRIVGLPGDRIQMKAGLLHLDGQPVKREQIEDYEIRPGHVVPQYLETLPGGRAYQILEEFGDTSRLDNTREYTIPSAHYFALGDNRDNSLDSRVIGFIPAETFIGRAALRIRGQDFSTRFYRTVDGAD